MSYARLVFNLKVGLNIENSARNSNRNEVVCASFVKNKCWQYRIKRSAIMSVIYLPTRSFVSRLLPHYLRFFIP